MHIIALEGRIAGCLFGGAIGDALGSMFEGRPAGTNFVVGPHLRVTDDTQLTLATCESIIAAGAVIPESIADSFVRWFRAGRLKGIGASTLKSLTELAAGGHWALVGATGEMSAGNGAAMRVAPLAFVLDPFKITDRQMIRDVCRITHRNDEAYVGALAVLCAIRHVIAGNPCDDRMLTVVIDAIPDSRVRDRLIEVRDASPSVIEYARRYSTTGYVVDSVPVAIVAAIRTTGFLETIEQIVRCGGDVDTIASIYGNIHGAARGTSGLPMDLFERIDVASLVRDVAMRIAQAAR